MTSRPTAAELERAERAALSVALLRARGGFCWQQCDHLAIVVCLGCGCPCCSQCPCFCGAIAGIPRALRLGVKP